MSDLRFPEKQLTERLQCLKTAMEEEQAPQRIEQALLRAFRSQQTRPAAAWWPRWALAAGVVVVVTGLSFLLTRGPLPSPVIAEPAEPVAEFVPLVPDPAWAQGETGQILRVSMPRKELVWLGLPVDEDRAFEIVTADLIVGQDMVARAIRIVH
jgi:hypothetical protein